MGNIMKTPSIHCTELTADLISYLHEYLEVNSDGHIITKKQNTVDVILKSGCRKGRTQVCGGVRTDIGKRRGTKYKNGYKLSFKFNHTNLVLSCYNRDLIWVLNNGVYDSKYKVAPINGDVFDDRINNLHLVRRKTGRPAGSKDKSKRATKNTFSLQEQREVLRLRKEGYTHSYIVERLKLTINVVVGILNEAKNMGRLKPFPDPVKLTKLNEVDFEKKQCGVYGILATVKTNSKCRKYASKLYIGSSVNMRVRLQAHLQKLKQNKHYNTSMQKCFNSGDYSFKLYVIEECEECDLLYLENKHIQFYEFGALFNTWVGVDCDEMKPHLDSVLHRIHPGMYTITENGCWECNNVHKSGYGRDIRSSVGERGQKKSKYIRPHRLSYYKHYGEYPELVRHKCDNRSCINPEHLESGSHRDNALDKNKQFRKDFEAAWLKFEGNAVELTKHFEFKPNCGWVDGVKTISASIYGWERKLGLRDKYPHIMSSRKFMSPHGQEAARIKRDKQKKAEKNTDRGLQYEKG